MTTLPDIVRPLAGIRLIDKAEALTQEAAKQALQPTPGLIPGLLVNTSVYILGLKVLLKGVHTAKQKVMVGSIHSVTT